MVVRMGKYLHYKGKEYEVFGVAKHSETLEELIVYRALYEGDFPKNQLWVRPKSIFEETVEVNGDKMPRFKFIED